MISNPRRGPKGLPALFAHKSGTSKGENPKVEASTPLLKGAEKSTSFPTSFVLDKKCVQRDLSERFSSSSRRAISPSFLRFRDGE